MSFASNDDIIFNWLWLQNVNISTSFKDDDNLPNIDLSTFTNPVIDGGGVLKRRYTKKSITLKGYLKSSDASELNNLIDLFKVKTSVVEWYLDIKVNGYYRRTKATVVKNDILAREHYHINVVPFSITFETLEPFFYNRDNESITLTGITGNTSTETQYTGTAPSNPKIYMVFDVTTGTENIVFSLNNRKISINQAVSDGDVLQFDSITKSVFYNGVEIEYTGSFPQMTYWDNLFDFQVDWSPNVDITILYATNFL